MKNLLLILLLVLYCKPSFSQKEITCCSNTASASSKSPAARFAMLASDESFRQKHEAPLPFTLKNGVGEMISFDTKGGKKASGYFIKANAESKKYVFVFHEWWGLNDYVKQEAEKLYKDLDEVNVLAIDLYDGKVTTDADEARRIMEDVKDERAEQIIEGALDFAGKNARVATVGWCFGGTWSLQAAIMMGSHVVGCVMYYGMPEDDEEKLKELKTPVLAFFGSKDKHITAEIVQEFEEDMEEADEEVEIELFDADHAFANPSNPHFDKKATEKAYKKTIKFLEKGFEEAEG